MIRATLGLGDFPEWDVYNTALEAFIAPDKSLPRGAPGPTPWGVQGAPSPPGFPPTRVATLAAFGLKAPQGTQLDRPDINFADSRWGARLLWTWRDVSFTLAHISTYPEGATPALRLNHRGELITKLLFPNVQVTGFTATTPVSTFQVPVLRNLAYTIFRTEWAGFFGEPFFIENINFALGKRLPKRDVIRGMIGLDHNQWLRALNPANTFFFSGQFFYTAVQGNMEGIQFPLQRRVVGQFEMKRSLCNFRGSCNPRRALICSHYA